MNQLHWLSQLMLPAGTISLNYRLSSKEPKQHFRNINVPLWEYEPSGHLLDLFMAELYALLSHDKNNKINPKYLWPSTSIFLLLLMDVLLLWLNKIINIYSWLLLINTKIWGNSLHLDESSKAGQQPQNSYQNVPFQKKTWFNGDADAGLAVTLNVTEKENPKKKHHNMFDQKLLNECGVKDESWCCLTTWWSSHNSLRALKYEHKAELQHSAGFD